MADSDYVCVYRQFFEEFAKVNQTEEKGPMRVNLYNLTLDELVGEVMQSCVNYLNERKCPKGLIVPLTKIVVEEFIIEAKKQPEEVNNPLKLNKKTHDKISEVCLRYTDNEKLSSLPGPVQETFYSTHSTKHTRRRMEDRLICLPRFNSLHGIQSNSEAGYYGIFDGHSGVNAANYAVSHLCQFLAESEFYPDDPVQAFRQAIEKTETRYNSKDDNSGTAVLAILHQPVEKKLTVVWVGDSQAMLVDEDSYIMLVDPHKPERKDERKRIEEMGGFITKSQNIYRVNGGLAISRAIGDKKLKPHVSAEPEIRVLDLKGCEHFIVMGCDGLWDVVEPQQVIETVYFEIKKNEGKIDTVGRRLVDLAKENNSTDNISVIVIFLTDPAEIFNRSVDLTGHRPKILLQDGVIMETNFQTNEESPMNDPGINGIYETNGTHFDDHMRNESDEDFGPETNVDSVDDVMTSPKGLNPFAGENNWQKLQSTEENTEKLIEFSRQEPLNIENEIMMFSEGFTEPAKNLDEKSAGELNSDTNFEKFPVNNIDPFESEVKNNMSEPFNFSNSITDKSDLYVTESNSKKKEIDNFMNSNFLDESSYVENEAEVLKEFDEKNSTRDPFGFVDDCSGGCKENNVNEAEKDSTFNNEVDDLKIEKLETSAVESQMQKILLPQSNNECHFKETDLNVSVSPEIHDVETSNKVNEFSDFSFKANEEAVDSVLQFQSIPLDATGHPPKMCSVIDVVEVERDTGALHSVEEEEDVKKEVFTGELLSPSAPAFEGEVKDEIVAESGGEVEDSEDDEWKYIKVESGVHQTVPIVNKDSDLDPPFNDSSDIEKPTMNSPLNPEADEFIPVSSTVGSNEYNINLTPIKAIPDHFTDIIASSPDWNNMNNVNVPEESAFLSEIKTRPSNIYEGFESVQEDDNFAEKNVVLDNSLGFISLYHGNKENDIQVVSEEEPQGIDLARDMTSSFIDPSTMSSNNETSEGHNDFIDTHKEEPAAEKNWSPVNEPVLEVQKVKNLELDSSLDMPNLLSSLEAVSPVSHTPETPKSTEVEISKEFETEHISPDLLQLETSSIVETPVIDACPSPTVNEQLAFKTVEFAKTSEPVEKFSVEEKSNETASPRIETAVAASATAAAVAGAAGIAAAKKAVKKEAPKTTPGSKATKTISASKPLPNGTKTSVASKKPVSAAQVAKTSAPTKVTSTVTKATVSKVSAVNKTTAKPAATTTVNSTLSKVPPRPRPASVTSTVSKTSSPLKMTSTISTTKPATTRPSNTPTVGATAPKLKPRAPSASVEKSSTLNGDAKTTIKRTEITKKSNGNVGSVTTTTTTTTTRVSLSARPATAPAKPTVSRTTTRTVSSRPTPKTAATATSSTASPTSKVSPTSRKTAIGPDKQAKEASNRLTSRTSTATKTNGVLPGKVTMTTTKTKKILTTSTTTPSKMQTDNKTETKAEKIIEEKVTIIQNENETPSIETNANINLINSFTSD